jgi:hypothetical protein
MRRIAFVCIAVFVLAGAVGCGGPSGGGGSDTGVSKDTMAGDAGADIDVDGLCGKFECGENAVCVEGVAGDACRCKEGYRGDPYVACEKPTEQQCEEPRDCPDGSICLDGLCRCDPYWELGEEGTCERMTTGSPKGRSAEAVCREWRRLDVELNERIWAESPAMTCQPGRLKAEVQRRALLYTNVFRWLVGLDPLMTKPSNIEKAQACATTLSAEGAGLTHDIPSDYACYTDGAAEAAKSSNLAVGGSHPAPTVPQYIEDTGNPSLGHRRWIFSPTIGTTGFGHRGRYGCMWVVGRSGTDTQTDVYYPAPGPFPAEAVLGPWSYMATGLKTEGADVEVAEVESGASVEVTGVKGYGGPLPVSVLRWDVPGAETGVAYEVRITGLGAGGDVSKTYRTTLVGCAESADGM